jgi:hypothetical protein
LMDHFDDRMGGGPGNRALSVSEIAYGYGFPGIQGDT